MEDGPTEVVCANGDLYRIHDSTQAQHKSVPDVFHILPVQLHALCKVKISTSETRTTTSTSAKTSLLNLFDPSQKQVYKRIHREQRSWIYKSKLCTQGIAHDVIVPTESILRNSRARTLQRFSRTVEVTISDRPRQLPHVDLTTVNVTQCCSEVDED